MSQDTELARYLSTTLRRQAEQVVVDDRPFDPWWRPGLAVALDVDERALEGTGRKAARGEPWAAGSRYRAGPGGGGAGRPRGRLVAGVAAAVVLVAGSLGAWAVVGGLGGDAGDGGEEGGLSTGPAAPEPVDPVAPAFPDGSLMAPSEPPPGYDLWGFYWGGTGESTSYDGGQLFEAEHPAGGRLLVEWDDGSDTMVPGTGHDSVTVRGVDGRVSDEGLSWVEDGFEVSATYRDMSTEEAIALLDGLELRSGDPGGGFDAAEDEATLLGEVLDQPEPGFHTGFTYNPGMPVYGLESLEAGTAPLMVAAHGPSGGMTLEYLRASFAGERDEDGIVVERDDIDTDVTLYWPDGATVRVGAAATPLSEEDAEAFARSFGPRSPGELAALWSDLNERVQEVPIVHELALPSGTVELRGHDGAPVALCLRLEVGTSCESVDPGLPESADDPTITAPVMPPPDELDADLLVGEEWYVLGAATGGPPTVAEDTPAGTGVPAEEGTVGGWHVVLAQPPQGIDVVQVADHDTGFGTVVERPWSRAMTVIYSE